MQTAGSQAKFEGAFPQNLQETCQPRAGRRKSQNLVVTVFSEKRQSALRRAEQMHVGHDQVAMGASSLTMPRAQICARTHLTNAMMVSLAFHCIIIEAVSHVRAMM